MNNKINKTNRILYDSIFRPLPVLKYVKDNIVIDYRSNIKKVHKNVISKFNIIENCTKNPSIFSTGDYFPNSRLIMKNLGLDLGTKNIVISFKKPNGEVAYINEVNGYWPFERVTPFIKNMLDDPNKVRSDGTKRPARWVEMDGMAIVLGKDAEEFAFSKNDTLRRPMAEGGIAPDEEAMSILSIIVQGLLRTAEDIGSFDSELKLCYCTTAPAINKNINIDYHTRVVDTILNTYETKSKIVKNSIKESHAIVIDSSSDGTGIGISWGAGTVTVSYVKYGMDIFSFCWVGSGDWIDKEVAMRHGYDPDTKKKSKETPTTVSRRKQSIDLTPGSEPTDRVGMDIVFHYDILINKVIDGIINGFNDHENEARIDDGINIYMAGGTSCPNGFVGRVTKALKDKSVPFAISDVIRTDDPLFTVARGCLKASEMF